MHVQVISPLQQQTPLEAASNQGHTLQVSIKRKLIFPPFSLLLFIGVDFIPLVAEILDGLAEDTRYTIRSIGQAIEQRAVSDPFTCTRHLFLHVAISLWHGNASLWLHRHPTFSLPVKTWFNTPLLSPLCTILSIVIYFSWKF